MKPSKTLPDQYRLDATLDLTNNRRVLLGLNLVGLVIFFLLGPLFWLLAVWLRPEISLRNFGSGIWGGLVVFVGVSIFVIGLHELVHGLLFWVYLRDRPTFGFRGAYAFAAAPDWYIPRPQFVVVGLAPLVLITAAGFFLLLLLPSSLLPPLLFGLTINAAGAVGDLYVVGWLMTKPDAVLVNDEGDRFSMFVPRS